MERRSEKDYGKKSEKDYGRKFEEDFGRKSDCDISLGVIKTFFDSFIDSLRRSGLLTDSRKKSKKNKGGKQARARRRERREEERRRASSLSSSPPPLTSAVDSDAAEVCMEKNDAWIDMGHIKNEVEVVSQQFCNNVTQGDRRLWNSQMQGCQQIQGDRQNYQLQGCQQLQPDQLQELGENLNFEQWYFGSIPLQTAKDLLHEFNQSGTFLVRDSDKNNGFMLIWLNERNKIMNDEILFDGNYYRFKSCARSFLSVKMLVEYLEVRCNFRVLPNKNQLKKLSQLRLRRSTEKLTFCWYCLRYHNQIHFCKMLQLWRKIDYGNCIVLHSNDRNAVERYKEEHGNEFEVNIWLYKSRQQMNERQKINAEEWKDQKEAQRYFENNKASFMEIDYKASYKHIENLSLEDRVKGFLHQKAHSLRQEMEEQKEAVKYFKENMSLAVKNCEISRSELYIKIQCGNLQEGVKKKVLEMFNRELKQPLH